jgi:hypothetical protein
MFVVPHLKDFKRKLREIKTEWPVTKSKLEGIKEFNYSNELSP